jgi:hypothetical protein
MALDHKQPLEKTLHKLSIALWHTWAGFLGLACHKLLPELRECPFLRDDAS